MDKESFSPELSTLSELFEGNDELYQLVLDSIPSRVFWKDLDLVYLGCNSAFAHDAGLSGPADIIGKKDSELPWNHLADQFNADDRKVILSGTPKINFEENHITADGSISWVETSKIPLKDETGNVIGIMGSYQDITGRKRSELELKQSESRFRDFVEAAADRFWETDKEFRYKFVGQPTKDLTLSEDKLIGKKPWEVDGVRSEHWDNLEEMFSRHEAIKEFHYDWLDNDGVTRHLHMSAVPYFDDNEKFSGYRGTISDRTDEVQARLQATDQEKRFFDTIENLSLSISLYDDHDQLVMCNSKMKKELSPIANLLSPGTSIETIVRAIEKDVLIPEENRDAEAWVQKTLEEHRLAGDAGEQLMGDGHWSQVSRIRTHDGGTLILRNDVTDQKKAERELKKAYEELENRVEERTRELRERELRFKDFANSAADRFWETNSEHRYVEVSDPVKGLTRPAKDVHGKTPMENFEGQLQGNELEKLSSFFEEQKSFRNFPITWDLDGVIVHGVVTGIPFYSEDGEFKGFRGTTTDVTAEVLARQKANELQNRFTNAIDNLNEGFILWDSDDRLVTCNSHFKKMYPEISDKFVQGVKHEEVIQELAPIYLGLEETNQKSLKKWVAERQLNHSMPKSETEFSVHGKWIRVSKQKLPNGDIVAIHTDVTDYKNREAELWAAKEKAEIADRSKSEFLANMSHELRTPLNAIIGFSDIFKDEIFGPLGDKNYAEYAKDINNSGRHLLDMINDILDVSVIEDGTMELVDIEVDIAETTESVIQLVEPSRAGKEITIKNHINDNTPRITGDGRRIKQILSNLLSNAVKYTGQNGTIDVNADIQEDGSLNIKIADSGIGMDENGLEIALKKFGQVDGDLTREQEGAGLGLPLTKGLVEAHEGTLTIKSSLGHGTTVNVHFPKKRVAGSR